MHLTGDDWSATESLRGSRACRDKKAERILEVDRKDVVDFPENDIQYIDKL